MTVGNPALWNICKLLGEKTLKVLITRKKPFVFLLSFLTCIYKRYCGHHFTEHVCPVLTLPALDFHRGALSVISQ